MSNFPLRGGKGSTWEGGIRVVGFVNGAGLDDRVKGTVNHNLFHISDWYHTIFELVSQGEKKPVLKPNERPFLDGDGISQWKTLSSPDVIGERNEIFIATQANGSQLQAHALRVGEMKILKYPILLYNKPLWYVVTHFMYKKKLTQQNTGTHHLVKRGTTRNLRFNAENQSLRTCQVRNVWRIGVCSTFRAILVSITIWHRHTQTLWSP